MGFRSRAAARIALERGCVMAVERLRQTALALR